VTAGELLRLRLLSDGVERNTAGLPPSQLAVLSGSTHITIVNRADWLVSMISAFLEMTVPDT